MYIIFFHITPEGQCLDLCNSESLYRLSPHTRYMCVCVCVSVFHSFNKDNFSATVGLFLILCELCSSYKKALNELFCLYSCYMSTIPHTEPWSREKSLFSWLIIWFKVFFWRHYLKQTQTFSLKKLYCLWSMLTWNKSYVLTV